MDKKTESQKEKEMFGLFKKKNEKKTEVLSHADYNLIFDNKEVEETPIEVLEIGMLNVPSGQIVVCDPLVYSETTPLTRTVTPGKYPVKIYVAKTKESGDRYAVAKLEFSNKKAVKWVMALRAEDDINELTDEADYFGFPVDAGLGGFYDFQSGKVYQKFESDFMKANPEGNIYDDFFAEEFKKNAKDQNDSTDSGDWINFQLPNSELNITMFHSGYGDGMYPSYWGIDKDGEIVSLVIDFLVLLVPEYE
ncbi:hypothetical protein DNC80_11170 [Flavobacterium sp. SOK18b]|nr:hypothetical protein [Flavobacterium sp. SOK18b]